MWKCNICNYKNNNSSENCHGLNCEGIKEKNTSLSPTQDVNKSRVKKDKRIYDFCPACKEDKFFMPVRWKGKKAWSCESKKHRPCDFTGKSKPFPLHLPQVNM